MSDKVRLAIALFGAWGLVLAVIAASVLLVGADMAEPDRALMLAVLQQRAASLVVVSLLLVAPLWFILQTLFRRYVRAPRQLAEDARVMLGANPAHRAPVRGSTEIK
jgi:hypothetical protein